MSALAGKLARLRPMPQVAPQRNAEEKHVELERLKRQIARVMGRPAPRVERRQLPFEAYETPAGTCHVLRTELGFVERLGGIALERSLLVDAALLGLLALTPELAGCDFERAVYLDLETTGLGGGTGNVAFLAGLCFYDAARKRLVLEQLLLRDPSSEPALLEWLRERLLQAEVWVSFNGKTFDLPVLRARFVMNRLSPLCERPQLDLLHVARRVHRHRSCKKALKVLEREVLDHDRGVDVAGCDMAVRYQHFLRTGDESGLEAVVTHNAQDVLSMLALVALYGAPFERSRSWLPPEELASMARVIRRAGDLDAARIMAERAVARGAGAIGLRARAEIAKALGDRAQALEDLEAVAEEVDDPNVRLELAKLYEHHLKRPDLALDLVRRGTSEKPRFDERRRVRLERKLKAES